MPIAITKYETDEFASGQTSRVVLQMRVEQDVLSCRLPGNVVNVPTNRGVTIPITVVSNPAPGKSYLRPRGMMIRWVSSAPPGYEQDGRIYVPVLQVFRFRSVKVGGTGTYKGLDYIIVSKLPELIGA